MPKQLARTRRQATVTATPTDEGSLRSWQAAMFSSITAQSQGVSTIVARLRTAIDLGFFEDGELLPKEAVLAEALQVSGFALREALSLLRQEGLVETRAGRGGGTIVRRPSLVVHEKALKSLCEMSSVSLRDLADWRKMLLSEAASLSARRSSQASLERLGNYVSRVESAASENEAGRAHARFDVELGSAAQSVRLTSAVLEVYEKYGWLIGLTYSNAEFRGDSVRILLQLVEALRLRDSERASALAREHAAFTFDSLVRLRLSTIAEQVG